MTNSGKESTTLPPLAPNRTDGISVKGAPSSTPSRKKLTLGAKKASTVQSPLKKDKQKEKEKESVHLPPIERKGDSSKTIEQAAEAIEGEKSRRSNKIVNRGEDTDDDERSESPAATASATKAAKSTPTKPSRKMEKKPSSSKAGLEGKKASAINLSFPADDSDVDSNSVNTSSEVNVDENDTTLAGTSVLNIRSSSAAGNHAEATVEEELVELREQVEKHIQDGDEWRKQLDNEVKSRWNLVRKVKTLEQTIEEMKKIREKEIHSWELERSVLQKEVKKQKRTVKDSKKLKIQAVHEQKEVVRQLETKHEEDLLEWKSKVEQEVKLRAELEEVKKGLDRKLLDLRKQLNNEQRMKEEIVEMKAKLEDITQSRHELDAEKKVLTKKLDDHRRKYETELLQLQNEKATLEKELHDLRHKYSVEIHSKQDLVEQCWQLEAKLDELRKKEHNQQRVSHLNDELKSQLEEYERANHHLVQKLQVMEKDKTALERRLNRRDQQQTTTVTDRREKEMERLKRSAQREQQAKSELDKLKRQFESKLEIKAREKVETLQKRLDMKEQSLKKSDREVIRLKGQLEARKNEQDSRMRAKVTEAERKWKQALKAKASASEANARMEKQINRLKRCLDTANRAREILKERYGEDKKSLDGKLAAADSQIEDLKREIAELKHSLAEAMTAAANAAAVHGDDGPVRSDSRTRSRSHSRSKSRSSLQNHNTSGRSSRASAGGARGSPTTGASYAASGAVKQGDYVSYAFDDDDLVSSSSKPPASNANISASPYRSSVSSYHRTGTRSYPNSVARPAVVPRSTAGHMRSSARSLYSRPGGATASNPVSGSSSLNASQRSTGAPGASSRQRFASPTQRRRLKVVKNTWLDKISGSV